MFTDSKLNFEEHIKGVFDKTSKSIGLIRKLRIWARLVFTMSQVQKHYEIDVGKENYVFFITH